MEREFGRINNLFFGIELLIWIVGTGTLLAGVIGVTNIMLIIVKERTKEIGIRRAIGATPISITSQIVLEAIILTLVSGYIGLLVGVGVNETIAWAMDTFQIEAEMYAKPSVDLSIALKALGILVVSGAFAGLLPAARAVSIKPVDALRAE
jgi:putative ABC transport system permease protein